MIKDRMSERKNNANANEKEQTMDGRDSFIVGFNYGRAQGIELTAREIATQFPDVNADAFAQGNIDGMHNERFRLDLMLTK